MKKIVLTAISTLFSLVSFAQDYSNAIKANPLALFGGVDLVSYERAFSEHSTGIVGVGTGGFNFADVKYSASGGTLQYRYYFREAIDGWYLGAGVQYQTGSVEIEGGAEIEGETLIDDESIDFSAFGGGIRGGRQWAWDSGFTLDLNLGINLASFSYDEEPQSAIELRETGIVPAFGLALGYAW